MNIVALRKKSRAPWVGLMLAVGLAANSHGALITTSSAGTVVDFSQFGGDFVSASGPVEVGGLVGESISWSSSSVEAVIGNGVYALAENTQWNADRHGYTGLNNTYSAGEHTRFDFNEGPVGSVGGFVNYAVCASSQCDPAQHFIIQALGAGDVVLETYDISQLAPISTSSLNEGAFRGIARAANDIFAFRLFNAVHVLDNLTFSRQSATVPEPAAAALLATALGALGWARRRRTF